MISISSSAIKEIKRIQSQRQISSNASIFKLEVKSGGCSGMFYDLTLEDIPPNDKKYRQLKIESINLLVNTESESYMKDLKIDYSEDLMGGGFRFHNPQLTEVCSCGISFRGQK